MFFFFFAEVNGCLLSNLIRISKEENINPAGYQIIKTGKSKIKNTQNMKIKNKSNLFYKKKI